MSNTYVINTYDFVKKNNWNIDLNNKIMVSFDVGSLFTNAPFEDTMVFLKYHLVFRRIQMTFNSDVGAFRINQTVH